MKRKQSKTVRSQSQSRNWLKRKKTPQTTKSEPGKFPCEIEEAAYERNWQFTLFQIRVNALCKCVQVGDPAYRCQVNDVTIPLSPALSPHASGGKGSNASCALFGIPSKLVLIPDQLFAHFHGLDR